MSESKSVSEHRLRHAVEWALGVDQIDCVAFAEAVRQRYPELSSRELAARVVKVYSRKSTMHGVFTGLPSNPFLAAGAALIDVAVQVRFHAQMASIIGYLADPAYFENPAWKFEALLVMAGPKTVSRVMHRIGVESGKLITRKLITRSVSKEVLEGTNRLFLKWLAARVSQRALIAKSVPIVGGIIGGAWNLAEIRSIGRRIISYHFDGQLA